MIKLSTDQAWPTGEETFRSFPILNFWTIGVLVVIVVVVFGVYLISKQRKKKKTDY